MTRSKSQSWALAGAIVAAVGASACCILPIAVALLGVGSAAFGAKLEPFRPWLLVATAGLLGAAFFVAYRPRHCAPGEACASETTRRRSRWILWLATLLAVALMTFPYYSSHLF